MKTMITSDAHSKALANGEVKGKAEVVAKKKCKLEERKKQPADRERLSQSQN